jgi:Cys-tRNA(Pro) deacylase
MSRFRTKITKLLDQHHIPYTLLPHQEPVFTIAAAAAQRGVVREEMVKSILLREKKGCFAMACLPGDAKLDPKAVRAQLGADWKRLSFASADEIETVTGYVQGAVAPLGLPEDVPVIFDITLAQHAKVNISSGDPMAGIELATPDLIRLVRAQLAPITKNERQPTNIRHL